MDRISLKYIVIFPGLHESHLETKIPSFVFSSSLHDWNLPTLYIYIYLTRSNLEKIQLGFYFKICTPVVMAS